MSIVEASLKSLSVINHFNFDRLCLRNDVTFFMYQKVDACFRYTKLYLVVITREEVVGLWLGNFLRKSNYGVNQQTKG